LSDLTGYLTIADMTKDTGVPKLKGATNLAIWLFRLERHITAKGTWNAVRFVPYRRSTRQTTPPQKSSAPDNLSKDPIRETAETTLPGQTETDLEKRQPKFSILEDYQDFDFGLDFEDDRDGWVLHPNNNKAINDIIIHYKDIPARKVDGIIAARWVINTLLK